jgi:hypothetical protein
MKLNNLIGTLEMKALVCFNGATHAKNLS